MNYNVKNILRAAAALCTSIWLSSCATYAHPGTTLYWSGKDISEFIADKGLGPDAKKICKDKDKAFLIYGFAKPIYHTYDREVGRSHHAYGTTIYTQTEHQFTGKYRWNYVFTDINGKITSHRSDTGFGDINKEFNCQDIDQVMADKAKLTQTLSQQSLWMSIAGSTENNKMLWVTDKAYRSQKEAEKDALNQCKDGGGQACKVILAYSNLCLSSGAGERNGAYFDVLGFGLNKAASNKDVIEQCQAKGGRNCKIAMDGACATACDMEHEKGCLLPEPQVIKP